MLMENTTNAALHRRPREYERAREHEAERKHCDKALDKSLKGIVPASDPSCPRAGPTVSPQRTLS